MVFYILAAVIGALVALAFTYRNQIAFAVDHKDQIALTANAVDSVSAALQSFGIKL